MADNNGNSKTASPTDELGEEFRHLLSALAGKVLSGASDRVGGITDKLGDLGGGGDDGDGVSPTK
jgi:hypothetical protein